MDSSENRQIGRDSLFLMAAMRVDGLEGEHRVKVRNLSDGGMMGEGPVRLARGSVVETHIRNIGWVEGTVAWIQEDRFGVAFTDAIDSRLVRMQNANLESADYEAPRYTRQTEAQANTGVVRKI